jgi:hypothetical protein
MSNKYDDARALIWNRERCMWWARARSGYVDHHRDAGRYILEDAMFIHQESRLDPEHETKGDVPILEEEAELIARMTTMGAAVRRLEPAGADLQAGLERLERKALKPPPTSQLPLVIGAAVVLVLQFVAAFWLSDLAREDDAGERCPCMEKSP